MINNLKIRWQYIYIYIYDQSEGLQLETSIDFLDKPCLLSIAPSKDKNEARVTDYCDLIKNLVEHRMLKKSMFYIIFYDVPASEDKFKNLVEHHKNEARVTVQEQPA